MKVYISTDLEGVTGVFKFAQTRERGPEFREAMELLMGDIAAVAQGLRQAGVKEIYVLDGHNGGNNFIPKYMVSGVHYITGYPRRRILDESFDGYIMLGFHAMNGTPDGVLHHTQSSLAECKYFYDGVERGELYQSAVIAGHFNVPVILVTGDEATCREARDLFGEELPTVAVKKGLSREAAILLSPDDARALLVEGAKEAVKALPRLKPYKINLPVRLRKKWIDRTSNASLENPYFSEKEVEITSALDIIQ
jgi:D-amino peptidase